MSQLDQVALAATSIATPAAGIISTFADPTHKAQKSKDDAGFVHGTANNFSVVSQSPTAATRTYLTGSALSVPATKLQVGTMFRWKISMTKNANGTATSTFEICFGTAGTTADTARVSFTKPAGTAVADEAWVDIICTIRSIGAAGVAVGQFIMVHNLQITGHAIIPCVVVNTISSGFDMTVANLIVGICLTSGASDAIVIQMVQAEVINL